MPSSTYRVMKTTNDYPRLERFSKLVSDYVSREKRTAFYVDYFQLQLQQRIAVLDNTQSLQDLKLMRQSLQGRIKEVDDALASRYRSELTILDFEISNRQRVFDNLSKKMSANSFLKNYFSLNEIDRQHYLDDGNPTNLAVGESNTLRLIQLLDQKAHSAFTSTRNTAKYRQELLRLTGPGSLAVDIRSKTYNDMDKNSKNMFATFFVNGHPDTQRSILANQSFEDLKIISQLPLLKKNGVIRQELESRQKIIESLASYSDNNKTNFQNIFAKLHKLDQEMILAKLPHQQLQTLAKDLEARTHTDKGMMDANRTTKNYLEKVQEEAKKEERASRMRDTIQELNQNIHDPNMLDKIKLHAMKSMSNQSERIYQIDLLTTGKNKGFYQLSQYSAFYRAGEAPPVISKEKLLQEAAKSIFKTMDDMQKRSEQKLFTTNTSDYVKMLVTLPPTNQKQVLANLNPVQLTAVRDQLIAESAPNSGIAKREIDAALKNMPNISGRSVEYRSFPRQ